MSETLEAKCLHNDLVREGFRPHDFFEVAKLPEALAALAIEIARGESTDTCVVPGLLAFKGSDYVPHDFDYVAYHKPKQKSGKGVLVAYLSYKGPKPDRESPRMFNLYETL